MQQQHRPFHRGQGHNRLAHPVVEDARFGRLVEFRQQPDKDLDRPRPRRRRRRGSSPGAHATERLRRNRLQVGGEAGRIGFLTASSTDTPSPAQILGVHRALADAGIPHAIGGAVALAHYGKARPTKDIDVNVFVAPERRPDVERALARVEHRDLVHLFFSEDALHDAMPAAVREIPWAGETIPLVGPEHLIVRKTILDRPKDRVDIEAILAANDDLDLAGIDYWVKRLTA
jgi:hypothetical protein